MCPKPNTYIYIMSMSISCSMLCVSLVTIQMGRRESLFGRVPPVVEVPSVKQRRNSLSIPFFSHPTPKQGEGPKLLDDNLPVSLVVMVMHVTLTTSCQLHCIRLIISLYTIYGIYILYICFYLQYLLFPLATESYLSFHILKYFIHRTTCIPWHRKSAICLAKAHLF